MCGIVGFIDKTKKIDILNKMLSIQSYRGPDDRGIYFDESSGVHLGHNRLAIQDLSSSGHQPFLSDCKDYIIVYNGEVYNFNFIRKELEKVGYKFISNSDTEVILYAYKEWGINAISRFIGMFAFSILDKKENKLYLVRDRAGVKPLYYYNKDNVFLFSSELKSFHYHIDFKKVLHKEVLPYYFQFGYIPMPYSIFENCFKLDSGHYLEYDLEIKKISKIKYWDVNEFYQKPFFDKTEKEVLDDLESILDDAIDLRMISDVPVGVFLSGGYDSSLVSSILSKKQGKKISTFTIGFDDKKYNEAEHAKNIASYLGTDHTEYYMKDKDMFNLIEELPFYYDEPFGDSSSLATTLVSKFARKDVTVALSADGGDESFCGYSKYFFLSKFSNIFANSFKYKLLKASVNCINETWINNVNNMIPKNIRQTNIKEKYNKFKRAVNSLSQEDMFLNASSRVDKLKVDRLLKVSLDEKYYRKFGSITETEYLNQMMAIDYKTFMCDDVLTKVDRATMSVSLEGREPLLDHRIIEYMARVPLNLKYKNNEGKYLLRQILYKYIPKKMVDKPKSGFQIPLDDWLKNDLKSLLDKYINKSSIDSEIFNIEEIENTKKAFLSGNGNINEIWFILVYQMWKERWFE